ncbi:unnamed protein product [Adineta steineri]|uniref:Uncharacterized protein n=1 Tax=Adineta steineri TaxID=433720 RepID=A0A813MSG0_9BILA|nr:unnamed protein product [Adineta steineri]CAF3926876.1 unnamed protein product [Adineta steineri]
MHLIIWFIGFSFLTIINGKDDACLHNESKGKHCTSDTRSVLQRILTQPTALENQECHTTCIQSARYFLCFISIDRWLIIFGLCFCILFSINFPIWCQIDGSKDCTGAPNTFYPLFYTSYNLVITIGPFLIMILFGLLILRNLR